MTAVHNSRMDQAMTLRFTGAGTVENFFLKKDRTVAQLNTMLFQDRIDAGQRLANLLKSYTERPDVIVIAFTQGGSARSCGSGKGH